MFIDEAEVGIVVRVVLVQEVVADELIEGIEMQ